MNEYLVIDVETTIFQKGNPFSRRNECCYIGYGDASTQRVLAAPYRQRDLDRLRDEIRRSAVLVAFNAKFDLHWLTRLGITEWKEKPIWDLQIAEFVMSGQKLVMPSLQASLIRCGLPTKIDVISTEYWEKGIDTPNIPVDLMLQYTKQDIYTESLLYLSQLAELSGRSKMLRLIKLCNRDLKTIQEMEYNGSRFNTKKALADAQLLVEEKQRIHRTLCNTFGVDRFNPGSSDHVSAALFGGKLVAKWKRPYLRTIKGEEAIRFKHFVEERQMERLVAPLQRYKLKKEGYFSTSDEHLRSLKGTKEVREILALLARYSELDKLVGTYLLKLPNLIREMDWPEDRIHGQFNQCVVVTGRLSSSKPNRQNEPKEVALYYETDWPE